jgi:hypothetical protein
VRIGDGKVALKQFLGDIERLGLALFRGVDGRLYGYNGQTVRAIVGPPAERGLVQEAGGRTFLSTRSTLFELRGGNDALELVELAAPASVEFFFARFQQAPGSTDVVVFLREGIYRVDGNALMPLWQSAPFGMIDTTGFTTPIRVAGWGGTLFTTSDTVDALPRFHLLAPCGAE